MAIYLCVANKVHFVRLLRISVGVSVAKRSTQFVTRCFACTFISCFDWLVLFSQYDLWPRLAPSVSLVSF